MRLTLEGQGKHYLMNLIKTWMADNTAEEWRPAPGAGQHAGADEIFQCV
jgi:hypothetical protein